MNVKLLDEVDPVFDNRPLTAEEKEENSRFVRKLKAGSKAAPKSVAPKSKRT